MMDSIWLKITQQYASSNTLKVSKTATAKRKMKKID